jgi:DNA (cytosine-5)-methyltransferase 1
MLQKQDAFGLADLFCGGGGTSTGLLRAADELGMTVELTAVNHWDTAIATHRLNHPDVQHYNSDLERLDPRVAVSSGRLRLLVASPECTHFSRARGGVPMSKQSRASAKYILKWIKALDQVDDVLLENVPEFMEWGPLHRQCSCGAGPDIKKKHAKECLYATPIASRKGEYFLRFIRTLEANGYAVKWRVLNAANYGDATTRERLFIIARRGGVPVTYPEPTHSERPLDMFYGGKSWTPAEKIIDWTVKGQSIFNRKKPLVPNTMRRIVEGLKRFGGEVFLLGQQSGGAPRHVKKPIPTVTSSGKVQLVQPYIVEYHNGKGSESRVRSVHKPIPTIDTSNRFALAEPYLMQMDNGGKVRSLKKPMPTITSADAFAMAEPYLVEYYGTGGAHSVKRPLKTQTGKDRFGLVQPIIKIDGRKYILDILYRMLMPKELAAAMGFPKGYKFTGSREEVVKQIGNAVPVGLSYALSKHILETRAAYERQGRSQPTAFVRSNWAHVTLETVR